MCIRDRVHYTNDTLFILERIGCADPDSRRNLCCGIEWLLSNIDDWDNYDRQRMDRALRNCLHLIDTVVTDNLACEGGDEHELDEVFEAMKNAKNVAKQDQTDREHFQNVAACALDLLKKTYWFVWTVEDYLERVGDLRLENTIELN